MTEGGSHMTKRRWAVLGGDRRQTALVQLLRERGQTVACWGVPAVPDTAEWKQVLQAEHILLPTPLCRTGEKLNLQVGDAPTLPEILDACRRESRLFGGSIPPSIQQLARERGLSLTDVLCDEILTVQNAGLTAEGAIARAMEQGGSGLCGKPCLVLGFGRIGKLLAMKLRALGAEVTVAARNALARTWAGEFGLRSCAPEELEERAGSFWYVFNTVPSPVLSQSVLCGLPRRCLLLDLASEAGFSHEGAVLLGHTVLWERGIPGCVLPEAAAAVLYEAILREIPCEKNEVRPF